MLTGAYKKGKLQCVVSEIKYPLCLYWNRLLLSFIFFVYDKKYIHLMPYVLQKKRPYQEYHHRHIDQLSSNLWITDRLITSANHFLFYSWKCNDHSRPPDQYFSWKPGALCLCVTESCSMRVWSSPGQYPWLLSEEYTNQLPPQWNSPSSFALCREQQPVARFLYFPLLPCMILSFKCNTWKNT